MRELLRNPINILRQTRREFFPLRAVRPNVYEASHKAMERLKVGEPAFEGVDAFQPNPGVEYPVFVDFYYSRGRDFARVRMWVDPNSIADDQIPQDSKLEKEQLEVSFLVIQHYSWLHPRRPIGKIIQGQEFNRTTPFFPLDQRDFQIHRR